MKPWTTKEEKIVRIKGHLGADALASALGRSRRSVVCKASELGVSLRKPGVRKGLRLGQPRGVKITELVKDPDLLEALADGRETTRLVAIIGEYRSDAPLCPACSARPATKRNTGLCEVCHYNALAKAWREGKIRKKAKAEYYAAKKQGGRAVNCARCGTEYAPRLDREGRKSDRDLCPECRRAESKR